MDRILSAFILGAMTVAVIYLPAYLISLPDILWHKKHASGWKPKSKPDEKAKIKSFSVESISCMWAPAMRKYVAVFTDGFYYGMIKGTGKAISVEFPEKEYREYMSVAVYSQLHEKAHKAHAAAIASGEFVSDASQQDGDEGEEGKTKCGMPLEEFNKLPAWKRVELLKQAEQDAKAASTEEDKAE